MTTAKQEEFLSITIPMDVKYKVSAGVYLKKFLNGLKQGKIIANKCPACGRLQLPPRNVCGRCHVEMGEFVELATTGSLLSWSVVTDPIFDSKTGEMRPVPYAIGSIVPDGGPDVALAYYLWTTDLSKLKPGLRMKIVLKPKKERKGLITDIVHFRPIEE